MSTAPDRVVDVQDAFTSAFRWQRGSWIGMDEMTLPVARWSGRADPCDENVLSHCRGATLDIGCGPGRMAELLGSKGHIVLGIDVVPEAVYQTRYRGVSALLRDVFHRVPAEGRWETALLADGNIGIGGDPLTLLRRIREVLAPDGRAVVDLDPPGTGIRIGSVRIQADSALSEPFPWAMVGADMAAYLAAETGFQTPEIHRCGHRWYAVMEVAAR